LKTKAPFDWGISSSLVFALCAQTSSKAFSAKSFKQRVRVTFRLQQEKGKEAAAFRTPKTKVQAALPV
jgi:hypothetical protein